MPVYRKRQDIRFGKKWNKEEDNEKMFHLANDITLAMKEHCNYLVYCKKRARGIGVKVERLLFH